VGKKGALEGEGYDLLKRVIVNVKKEGLNVRSYLLLLLLSCSLLPLVLLFGGK
jgi:hypothetical protein